MEIKKQAKCHLPSSCQEFPQRWHAVDGPGSVHSFGCYYHYCRSFWHPTFYLYYTPSGGKLIVPCNAINSWTQHGEILTTPLWFLLSHHGCRVWALEYSSMASSGKANVVTVIGIMSCKLGQCTASCNYELVDAIGSCKVSTRWE